MTDEERFCSWCGNQIYRWEGDTGWCSSCRDICEAILEEELDNGVK